MMNEKSKHNLNDQSQPIQNAKLDCYKTPTSNLTIIFYSNSEPQKETCKSLVVTIFQIIDNDLFAYSTNRLQVAFNYVITAKLT